jgi:hypothetical protein
MNRDRILIVLTAAGSALCWWPAAVEPSIDFPRSILLGLVALMTLLSAILSKGPWRRLAIASVAGVFAGLSSGLLVFFPPSDGIAASYSPLVIIVGTLAAVFVTLPSVWVGRKLAWLSNHHRRSVWLAFVSTVAFGPVALALTPPIVAHRVARNDRAAEERFERLKSAVEQTIAESGETESICDGQALRRHYSGPPFSDEDWQRIAGNAVKQDGYFFMVYCHERDRGKAAYTITAHPVRAKVDGTRSFCTDESRKISSGMEWNRLRHACTNE